MKEVLRRGFEERWRRLKKRSEEIGLGLPEKEELWRKLKRSWRNGFRCEYCHEKLAVKDELHLRSLPSNIKGLLPTAVITPWKTSQSFVSTGVKR